MSFSIEVWGDYAAFNRPEFKTERVSYDVMTPSAARGILESIYWHPGMKWVIDRIHVCSPIRFNNIRTNEVDKVISLHSVPKSVLAEEPMYIATSECIQQRSSLVLRNVRYVIEAHFEMTSKANASDNPNKFNDIIRRRLEKGQAYKQPCLGVRDFPAFFKPCTELPSCPEELLGSRDLGWMLLDMDYRNPQDIQPRFFRAMMKDGVIDVPRMDAPLFSGF